MPKTSFSPDKVNICNKWFQFVTESNNITVTALQQIKNDQILKWII
jgi:hypothetical protein